MRNKEDLKKQIRDFCDKLKLYKVACENAWEPIHLRGFLNEDKSLMAKEEKLREELTEDWGNLESTFKKVGASLFTVIPNIGIPIYFFDEALSSRLDNPHKFEGLNNAISSSIKTIGIVNSLSDIDFKKLNKATPIVFISYCFKEENEVLITKLKDFLSSFPVAISTGAEPDIKSITEKVKNLINDSEFVLTILTKDEETVDGKWSPSKWVSDEIAYAIGKEKPVIRLLESGVVYKPGISGDIEYIEFDRNNLADSLIKLTKILNRKILL